MPPIIVPPLSQKDQETILKVTLSDHLTSKLMKENPGMPYSEARRQTLAQDSPFHKLLAEGIERVKEAVESEERLRVSAQRTSEVLRSAGVKDAPPTNDPAS